MLTDKIYDITIIGGGPVGLFTAFYGGLREAKIKIIDSLASLGGQPAHLYPEKRIFDIPAYKEITGEDLTHNLIDQLSRFNITYCLNEEVLNYKRYYDEEKQPYFILETGQSTHYTRTIIVAAGNGAFSPRKLTLPDAETYENSNLHYHIRNKQRFAGKHVAICGGGDSAVDLALALEPLASKVYLIHRRKNFRALESNVKLLNKSTVEILTPFVPSKLVGDGNKITQLIITKARTDETMNISIDDLAVTYGYTSSLGELRNWGFNLSRNAILVDGQMATSIPGIYAVGDIAQYAGKVKIIATGFGEAPQAINSALLYINPDNVPAPVHSTELLS